jgi:hypothetical protein
MRSTSVPALSASNTLTGTVVWPGLDRGTGAPVAVADAHAVLGADGDDGDQDAEVADGLDERLVRCRVSADVGVHEQGARVDLLHHGRAWPGR